MISFSVWLPRLFNPTSYLTAVMQVTARRAGMPLDQMTTENNGSMKYSGTSYKLECLVTLAVSISTVTTFLKHDAIDYYPQDGCILKERVGPRERRRASRRTLVTWTYPNSCKPYRVLD